jgi:hypothetical protein
MAKVWDLETFKSIHVRGAPSSSPSSFGPFLVQRFLRQERCWQSFSFRRLIMEQRKCLVFDVIQWNQIYSSLDHIEALSVSLMRDLESMSCLYSSCVHKCGMNAEGQVI